MRSLLRKQIRSVADGNKPVEPTRNAEGRISTYTGDFVIKVPPVAGEEENQQREFGRKLARILVDTLPLGFEDRQAEVKRRLLVSD